MLLVTRRTRLVLFADTETAINLSDFDVHGYGNTLLPMRY